MCIMPIITMMAVSIIIPTRDYVDILKKCIDSIYEKTTYKNLIPDKTIVLFFNSLMVCAVLPSGI